MPDTHPIVNTSAVIPARINPDDIFKRIDKVREGMARELEPSFLSQLVSSDKRRQARVIAEAKESAIRARRELIDGLAGAIKVYVDAHVGDLRVRAHAHVTATFTEMLQSLARAMEATHVSFLDAFSVSVDRIAVIPNLTEEQRASQVRLAWDRVERAQRRGEETFEQILDALREQVVQIVSEIGTEN